MLDTLTYKPFGSRAILVEWPARIDEAIVRDIVAYKEQVVNHYKDRLEDGIIGYHSLTLLFADEITDVDAEFKALQSVCAGGEPALEITAALWEIPVCYHEKFGIDLAAMSATLELSKEEIIRRHSQTIYTVYFIGFLPGFLYLGGLDCHLAIKRKSSPRLNVAKGSVAIGGSQTGIYPTDSAGGWHILGKTPISLFDVKRESPCFAQPGDHIRFVPVDIAEFDALERDVSRGTYKLRSNLPHD